MTITGQSSLDRKDIERMVRDAEAHAEDDRRRREEAEIRNDADARVYQTDKLLLDQGGHGAAKGPERDAVEEALAALKKALTGSDLEVIKSATERLNATLQPFAQRLYDASSSGAPNGSRGGPGAYDDEVVDAEIVDEERT